MRKFLAIFAVMMLVAFAAPAFAATNPFMDVPAGHWSYDAVAQLAATGVASGYPDGSYKGAQPATRYEMASMVARLLAYVDMEKASKQDVELLKKLVLEFKSELDALGVRVNDLDKRVAVLEDGIGGWKIRGIFVFDAKFGNSDSSSSQYSSNGKETEFDKERFRLFLTKTIDENTYFYAQYRTGDNGAGTGDGRGDQQSGIWSHLYIDTKLPWDLGLRVGRFEVDFESAYGLYIDNDALFGDFRTDGLMVSKNFGMLDVTAAVGRNIGLLDNVTTTTSPAGVVTYNGEGDYMAYVLDLHFQPSEKFFVGATGYWGNEDSSSRAGDWDVNTYAFYAGYSFTPNIALKGIYYFQDLGDSVLGANYESSPNAWKAIIDIKQEALKFTSLWIEYMSMDNSFANYNTYPMYGIGGSTMASVMSNQPLNGNTTTTLFMKAGQKWNDKWGTFLRFAWADYDTTGLDDSYEYGIGVTYQYTPAIQFELAYDHVDYGSNNGSAFYNDKESVFRFRTSVNF